MEEKDLNRQGKNFRETMFCTLGLSLIAIVVSAWIQTKAENRIDSCSYLDPVIIDFVAFLAGLFLVAEGLIGIFKHKSSSINNQLARIIRVSIGFAILTLHIIQFLHK